MGRTDSSGEKSASSLLVLGQETRRILAKLCRQTEPACLSCLVVVFEGYEACRIAPNAYVCVYAREVCCSASNLVAGRMIRYRAVCVFSSGLHRVRRTRDTQPLHFCWVSAGQPPIPEASNGFAKHLPRVYVHVWGEGVYFFSELSCCTK